MPDFLRRHATPPMFVAILALVLSVSGVSYAAHSITAGASTSGAERTTSRAVQPTLASGQTMRGFFASGAGDSANGYFGEGVTFPSKLPSNFNRDHVQYIDENEEFTDRCPGIGQAKRGWVCLYEGQSSGSDLCCIYDNGYNSTAVSRYGFRVYWDVTGPSSYADGMWVVRAP
jgi:hypothetical protein